MTTLLFDLPEKLTLTVRPGSVSFTAYVPDLPAHVRFTAPSLVGPNCSKRSSKISSTPDWKSPANSARTTPSRFVSGRRTPYPKSARLIPHLIPSCMMD
jgi:hypothetical protein